MHLMTGEGRTEGHREVGRTNFRKSLCPSAGNGKHPTWGGSPPSQLAIGLRELGPSSSLSAGRAPGPAIATRSGRARQNPPAGE